MMVFLMDAWSVLRPFVIFYGHLVQLVVFWYSFSRFGILYQEKSGNPDLDNKGWPIDDALEWISRFTG
jgi:hypothetical protein